MTNEPNAWLDADAVRLVERITRPLGGGNYHPEPSPEEAAWKAIRLWLIAAVVALGLAFVGIACGANLNYPMP